MLGAIVRDLTAERRFGFDGLVVIMAIDAKRVLDPGSERSHVRSFLQRDFAPQFEGIGRKNTNRSLQFLAEVDPALEAR